MTKYFLTRHNKVVGINMVNPREIDGEDVTIYEPELAEGYDSEYNRVQMRPILSIYVWPDGEIQTGTRLFDSKEEALEHAINNVLMKLRTLEVDLTANNMTLYSLKKELADEIGQG